MRSGNIGGKGDERPLRLLKDERAQESVCQEFETAGHDAARLRYGYLFQVYRGRNGDPVSEPDQSLPSRLCDAPPQVTYEVGVLGLSREALEYPQSCMSDLVRDKWDKFSLEMLIMLETRIRRRVPVEFAA